MPSLLAGQADGDEQPALAQELEAELVAGDLGREHEAGVHPAVRLGHRGRRLVGADRQLGAEVAHELEPVVADVDADDPVAEGVEQLHRVVAQPAGRPDHGDGAAGLHAVGESFRTAP